MSFAGGLARPGPGIDISYGTRWGEEGVRRLFTGLIALSAVLAAGVWITLGSATSAFADSSPYELVCPGTPVGTVVINGVVTTATITPANPSSGSTFNVTNYQTSLTLVSQITKAAAAIQPTIQGTANSTLDATGATPSSLAAPAVTINAAIPDQGANGVPLLLPTSPSSIGPFTATGSTISIAQDETAQLQLLLEGSPINTTCKAYPNNSNATGLQPGTTPVAGTPFSPTIATTSAGSGGSTAATTATTAAAAATSDTTAAPATSPASSSLATTGAGPGLQLLAILGAVLAGAAVFVLAIDGVRRRLLRGGHVARGRHS